MGEHTPYPITSRGTEARPCRRIPWILALMCLLPHATIVAATAEDATPYDVAQAPWPCWFGPYGSGSAASTGLKLVDDLNKARRVWVSEDAIPVSTPRKYYDKEKKLVKALWSGGYTTPITAEGRVYLAYWAPAGRTDYRWTEEDHQHAGGRRNNPTKDRIGANAADDIVLCLDGKTGKTLWKRVFAKGMLAGGYKQGVMQGMCYYRGRVYAAGTSGLLYALDAATGEPVWEGRTSAFGRVQGARKTQSKLPGRRPFICGSPAAIDGVVAISQGRVTAFDAQSGDRLWDAADRVAEGTGRLLNFWQHDGRGYFYGRGKLWEAKTGRLCWEIDGALDGVFSGDLLVTKVGEGNHYTPACYRVTPEACEQVWQASGYHHVPRPMPTIHDGYVYDMAWHSKRRACCFDLKTGKLVASVAGKPNPYEWGYSVLAVEGRVIPNMWIPMMINADPKDLRILNLNAHKSSTAVKFPKSEATACAYADGFLYFRGETKDGGRVYCYDLRR